MTLVRTTRYTPEDRVVSFWSKVEKLPCEPGCWLWSGALSHGYGVISGGRGNSNILAHRFSYELLVGAIPAGLQIDHRCRVTACVNPSHLRAVTPRVNTLCGESFSARNAAKTHCARGHELAPQNVRPIGPGGRWRHCRLCDPIWRAKHRPAYNALRRSRRAAAR